MKYSKIQDINLKAIAIRALDGGDSEQDRQNALHALLLDEENLHRLDHDYEWSVDIINKDLTRAVRELTTGWMAEGNDLASDTLRMRARALIGDIVFQKIREKAEFIIDEIIEEGYAA